MDIVGVDPGRTTGVAFLYDDGTVICTDYRDPLKIAERLLLCRPDTTTFVIERYYGGGLQSTDGEFTLRLVGYLEFRLLEAGRIVVMQSPQARRSQLAQAKQRLPLDKDRHKADALAHALVYRRKQRGGE